MGLFNRKPTAEAQEPDNTPSTVTSSRNASFTKEQPGHVTPPEKGKVPAIAVILGAIASIGGFMFGYESGQISGFLAMDDFKQRFGNNGEFSAVRTGTIVGLLWYVTVQG